MNFHAEHDSLPGPGFDQPRVFEASSAAEVSRVLADALAGRHIAVLPGAGVEHLTAFPVSAWGGEPVAGAGAAPALVVFTSGSTGTPKGVALSASALSASAEATDAALSGPGRWFLCLPPDHIAGAQVILRSLRSGTVPFDARGHFTADRFTRLAAEFFAEDNPPADSSEAEAHALPAYASLVPTQLARILDDVEATRQAARFDALLIGGASLHPRIASAAVHAGLNIVRTYGMSETGGGCVYDGVPFPGLELTIDAQGRVVLAGPVVADGYVSVSGGHIVPLDHSAFSVGTDGRRSFTTSDLGTLTDGVLSISGRVDDVFQSGGTNVSPLAVEALLLTELADDGIDEVLLVPIDDPEWGQLGALLVRGPGAHALCDVSPQEPGASAASTGEYYRMAARRLKTRVAGVVTAEQAPRWLIPVQQIPTKGIGKPDRKAARQLAQQALGGNEQRMDERGE